jgi:hypothetical protein
MKLGLVLYVIHYQHISASSFGVQQWVCHCCISAAVLMWALVAMGRGVASFITYNASMAHDQHACCFFNAAIICNALPSCIAVKALISNQPMSQVIGYTGLVNAK